MTVAELIRILQNCPANDDVLIARGEWGPSRIRETRITNVEVRGDVHNWEVLYPELPLDEDEERAEVVLID